MNNIYSFVFNLIVPYTTIPIIQFFHTVLPGSGRIDTAVWMLTKRLKKKQDSNYTRMLRVILNKSWRQHPTRHQLYGHQPPITKTIQVRRTRHTEHCWRTQDTFVGEGVLPRCSRHILHPQQIELRWFRIESYRDAGHCQALSGDLGQ